MVRRLVVGVLVAVVALLVGASWSSGAQAYVCAASTAGPFEQRGAWGVEWASAGQGPCDAGTTYGEVDATLQQWDGVSWVALQSARQTSTGGGLSVEVDRLAQNYWGCCAHYREVVDFYATTNGQGHHYGLITPSFDAAAFSVL